MGSTRTFPLEALKEKQPAQSCPPQLDKFVQTALRSQVDTGLNDTGSTTGSFAHR